jgi:hypothetical protein
VSSAALLLGQPVPESIQIVSADEFVSMPRADSACRVRATLIFGWTNSPKHRSILSVLTLGELTGATPVDNSAMTLQWAAGVKAVPAELQGFRVGLHLPSSGFWGFDTACAAKGVHTETLATLDGRPWFIRARTSDRWTYFLGVKEIPDGDAVVRSAEEELPLISTAIALITCLRAHDPEHAWKPSQPAANFIIDDPLLRPTYGCIEHTRLAKHVSESTSAATIAFIPWNARRSEDRTVRLFKETPGLSICAHGWEHIHDEFAGLDVADCEWRARSAMHGMRLHKELTGLDFDPVMVFPQGRFSTPGMAALAEAGFLAAVNSTFLAAERQDIVRLRHLLEPAITAYGAVPLFRRRGPRYVDRFRYDLVLGKPLLLVEHHQYFSDGGGAFRDVVESIRSHSPSVRWHGLEEIAQETHLSRTTPDGIVEVRMYARRFRLRKPVLGRYVFSKVEDGSLLERVLVNGMPVAFVREGVLLRTEALDVQSGHDIEVVVQPQVATPVVRQRRRRVGPIGVAVRRYGSEGRDHLVAVACSARRLVALLQSKARRGKASRSSR